MAGGSYLYLETLALLNGLVGIDARYAFRLFPTWGGSHLLSIDDQGQPSHSIGARLVPIAGGEDEFIFELLPVGLYLDVNTWKAVFTLELLTMRFLFSNH